MVLLQFVVCKVATMTEWFSLGFSVCFINVKTSLPFQHLCPVADDGKWDVRIGRESE